MQTAILTSILFLAISQAEVELIDEQGDMEDEQVTARYVHSTTDAIGWTFNSLVQHEQSEWPTLRYCYVPHWATSEWIGALDFAVNSAASHCRSLVRGKISANGYLVEYDLQDLAPRAKDLARLISTWDSLAVIDPDFHVSEINVDGADGTVAYLAPHLQDKVAHHATDQTKNIRVDELLVRITGTPGIVYRADFLIEQLLSSVYGHYPEFRQIDFKTSGNFTPVQAHLKKRGFFIEQTIDFYGENGAILIRSEVTGKSRVILAIPGLRSRTPLFITYDFKDASIRPDKQFMRNLVEFKSNADANELIVPMENGLWEGLVTNNKGEFQRIVPDEVAIDHTRPNGFTKPLGMGDSCIFCHGEHSGYQPVSNDLHLILGSDTDYFGSDPIRINRKGNVEILTSKEALDIVIGRYGEPLNDPDGLLSRARRDYIATIDRITDYDIEANEPSSAAKVAAKIREIIFGYRYRDIDAERALLELGVVVPQEKAIEVLSIFTKPDENEQEDILIALLRNGASLKRSDMQAVYVDLARRASTRYHLIKQEEQK